MAYAIGTNLCKSLIVHRYVDICKLFSEKKYQTVAEGCSERKASGEKILFLEFSAVFKIFYHVYAYIILI